MLVVSEKLQKRVDDYFKRMYGEAFKDYEIVGLTKRWCEVKYKPVGYNKYMLAVIPTK